MVVEPCILKTTEVSKKKGLKLGIMCCGFQKDKKPIIENSPRSGLFYTNTIFLTKILKIIIVDKFDPNHVLVNVNKLNPY